MTPAIVLLGVNPSLTACIVAAAGMFTLAAAALCVVIGSRKVSAPDTDQSDDDLAVARAAGVVPGEEYADMTAEERAAEAAWLAELFAASPDVDWRDCPVVRGREDGAR